MASDHLNIRVEYFTNSTLFHGMHRFTKQDFLLFSPSTVDTLCKELGHFYSLPLEAFMVYHNGVKLTEKQRIIDRYTYQVQVEIPKGFTSRPLPMPMAQKSVEFDSSVYIDPAIQVVSEPMKTLPIYVAFYYKHITYLLDQKHGAILSPHPRMRLGESVVYVDWGRFQPAMASCPTVEPMTWMYDRLQRDFGILPTSSIFGIHSAPLSQIKLYQSIIQQWLEKMGSKIAIEQTDEEEEQDDDEEEEEEEEEEEDFEDILDDIEYYVDDSEMWR
jgi:hypothetical protein